MLYSLYGKTVNIDAAAENYNDLRRKMSAVWDKAKEEFLPKYWSYGDLDSLMKGVYSDLQGYFLDTVEMAVKVLNEYGVHEYDSNAFIQTTSVEMMDANFRSIEDAYIKILAEQEAYSEYRRQRKDSRLRMQGGGFGLDGAIQGAAMAGAYNIASGATHSMVNAIGNISSGISASGKKKKIYENKDTAYCLMRDINFTIQFVTQFLSLILSKHKVIQCDYTYFYEYSDNEKYNIATAYFNNAKNGNIDEKEELDYLIKALQLQPAYNDIYLYLYEEYGDEDRELLELSSHFGVEEIFEKRNEDFCDWLSGINYFDENEFETDVKDFQEWCSDYGFENTDVIFDEIRKFIADNKTSMDGEVYESVEEAEKQKEYLLDYIKRVNQTSGNDRDSISTLIEEVENSSIKSSSKYSDYLKEQLKKEDECYRTVKGNIYDNRDLADQARTDATYLDSLLKDKTFVGVDDINNTKRSVDEIGTKDLKELYNSYLDVCSGIISEQDNDDISLFEKEYPTRRLLSEVYYKGLTLHDKSLCVNAISEKWSQAFSSLSQRYTTIKGVVLESAEADKAYFTMLKHARSYFAYISEKNAEKRSLFSKIKTGITGVVYNTYEPDYNELSKNGSLDLPADIIEEDEPAIVELFNEYQQKKEAFESEISNNYGRMNLDLAVEKLSLNVDSLYIETKKFDASDIEGIFKKYDLDIEINKQDENDQVDSSSIEDQAKESKYLYIETIPEQEKDFVVKTLSENFAIEGADVLKLINELPNNFYPGEGIKEDVVFDMAIQLSVKGIECDVKP